MYVQSFNSVEAKLQEVFATQNYQLGKVYTSKLHLAKLHYYDQLMCKILIHFQF